jgi:hypothetical protein
MTTDHATAERSKPPARLVSLPRLSRGSDAIRMALGKLAFGAMATMKASFAPGLACS